MYKCIYICLQMSMHVVHVINLWIIWLSSFIYSFFFSRNQVHYYFHLLHFKNLDANYYGFTIMGSNKLYFNLIVKSLWHVLQYHQALGRPGHVVQLNTTEHESNTMYTFSHTWSKNHDRANILRSRSVYVHVRACFRPCTLDPFF